MKRKVTTWAALAAILLLAVAGLLRSRSTSAEGLVRKVHVTTPPGKDFPTPGKVRVFQNPAELEAALPGATIDPSDAVDFDRENLVEVAWESRLCPERPWKWTARAGGRCLVFHEQTLAWGPSHDCFCRFLNQEWFAMPKGAHVGMNCPEHAARFRPGVAGALLVIGMGAFAIVSFLVAHRGP